MTEIDWVIFLEFGGRDWILCAWDLGHRLGSSAVVCRICLVSLEKGMGLGVDVCKLVLCAWLRAIIRCGYAKRLDMCSTKPYF
jgi:hypothetical protein